MIALAWLFHAFHVLRASKYLNRLWSGAENLCQVPRIWFFPLLGAIFILISCCPSDSLFIFEDYWWQFPSRSLYWNILLVVFAVWSSAWFIFISVSWVFEKHEHPVVVECSALYVLDWVYCVASDLRALLSFDLWDLLYTERS